MPLIHSLVVALVASAYASLSVAQDGGRHQARALAATCASCHGTDGVSLSEIPPLAGRPKDDLIRRMQDFKTGKVPATIMPQLAKGYTDEQIELIAGWFAAQKPAR